MSIPYVQIDPNELPEQGFLLLQDIDGQSVPATIKVFVAKNDFGFPTPGCWFKYEIDVHLSKPEEIEQRKEITNRIFNQVTYHIMRGDGAGEYEIAINFLGN